MHVLSKLLAPVSWKQNQKSEYLQKFQPVLNLFYLSKLTEHALVSQLNRH